jgi:hypothetical protein
MAGAGLAIMTDIAKGSGASANGAVKDSAETVAGVAAKVFMESAETVAGTAVKVFVEKAAGTVDTSFTVATLEGSAAEMAGAFMDRATSMEAAARMVEKASMAVAVTEAATGN